MPILDLQQREREIGRIRLGRKNAKGNPEKLDRFRITCADRARLVQVADLYGGEVVAWPNRGALEFEVITEVNRLPIVVPPQQRAISQWWELWPGPVCARRCDGKTNFITDGKCKCPADLAKRAEKAKIGQACKPTTRLSVMLRDVPGIGVWRVDSHGFNAAVTLPNITEFLAQATESGVYIPAELMMERQSVLKPDEKPWVFYVPVVDVQLTPRELMSGQIEALSAGERKQVAARAPKAIEAGPKDAAYFKRLADAAITIDQLTEALSRAQGAGFALPDSDDEVFAYYLARREELKPGPLSGEVVKTGSRDDADEVWMDILSTTGWPPARVREEFARLNNGLEASRASAAQLRAFLTWYHANVQVAA